MRRVDRICVVALSLSGVALAAGERALEGTVTGAGEPVADAAVVAVVKSWPGGRFAIRGYEADAADEAGRFTLADALPAVGTQVQLNVAAVAPGRALVSRYVRDDMGAISAEDLALDLPAGHPVTLRFLRDGKAAEGVEVYPSARFERDGSYHMVFPQAVMPLVQRSDAKGEVHMTWFRPGDRATIMVRYPGPGWTPRGFTVTGAKHESQEFTDEPEPTPAADHQAGDDPFKSYVLFGPKPRDPEPEAGHALVLVLPGGGGGADFRGFVEERYQDWVGGGAVMVQVIAPKWTADQGIVWPSQESEVDGMKFTTEEFVAAVVKDVAGHVKVDPQRVVTLSWSSSGPVCYRIHTLKKTPVTASLVAMSVFKPQQLDSKRAAKKRPLYIVHATDDQQCRYVFAEQARKWFDKAKCDVGFATYEGGHGWGGDSIDKAREGLAWLFERLGQ